MADAGIARKVKQDVAVSVAALRGAVRVAGSVVERRNTIPILSMIRLREEGGDLIVSGTDLDVQVVARVPVAVQGDLDVCVDARLLANVLKQFPGGDAALRKVETKLVLSIGTASYELCSLPSEDFPVADAPEGGATFNMAGPDLAVALNAVRHCISKEETRYYLNGVYMHIVDGALTFVATDGHRLARIVTPCPAGAETLQPSIVPTKMVDLLRRLAERASEPVRLAFSGLKMRASFDGFEITSKLINGTYPDYSRVIPSPDQAYRVTVDPSDLRGAVKRVAAIATEKTKAVKLVCDKAGVTLSCNSPENGKASDRIEARIDGGPVEIWFNKDYLSAILSGCIGEKVSLAFDHGVSPTLISDPSRPELTQVQMPMRV